MILKGRSWKRLIFICLLSLPPSGVLGAEAMKIPSYFHRSTGDQITARGEEAIQWSYCHYD